MLLQRIEEMVPGAIDAQRRLLEDHGDSVAATVTVKQVVGGLAGAKVLKSFIPGTPHFVDPEESLHVGGVGIFDICRERSFEWLIWTLYSGSPPTADQEEWVRARLEQARKNLMSGPFYSRVADFLYANAKFLDPMKAIDGALALLAENSRMAKKVAQGDIHEITWADRLEDQLDILGYLSVITPLVYRAKYLSAQSADSFQTGLRFAQAFVSGLGIAEGDEHAAKMARVVDQLMATMCYHGPGNVSTFDAIVASSGGANPFEVFGSMVGGLRGYNHGGAAEQGVRFLFKLRDDPEFGLEASAADLERLAMLRLTRDKLPVWCVGHRVIRGKKGDQRANATIATLREMFAEDPFFDLALRWYDGAKKMVDEHTGSKFPDVNVDGYTGLLAHLSGIIAEPQMAPFAGAFFATSRASGAFAETFWQAVGPLRLLRPSAHTEESIKLLPAA